MLAISDSFPDNFKENFANEYIKVGCVIKTHVRDISNPKEKRFIIIGISQEKALAATIFINSEINPNKFPTTELKNLHLFFNSSGREYLIHDSYVDCSSLYERPIETLKKILISDINSYLGEVNDEDINLIKNTIKKSKTVSTALKKKYGLFY